MKRPLYTRAHDAGRAGGMPTAEDHARFSRESWSGPAPSKRGLISRYMMSDGAKLEAVPFLARYAAENGVKRILSLGSGPGVLEYFLALSAPEGTEVFAADYDGFLIENARRHFPEAVFFVHDFLAEDVPSLLRKMGRAPDAVVFFGSSYVMDDAPFAALFAALRQAGAGRIVDFQPGVMDAWTCFKRWAPFEALRRVPFLRRAAGRESRGTFHGYQRSRGHLRELYRRAGFSSVRELSLGGYPMAAVCEAV